MTYIQRDRQTDRQIDRHRQRQTDRDREIERETERQAQSTKETMHVCAEKEFYNHYSGLNFMWTMTFPTAYDEAVTVATNGTNDEDAAGEANIFTTGLRCQSVPNL